MAKADVSCSLQGENYAKAKKVLTWMLSFAANESLEGGSGVDGGMLSSMLCIADTSLTILKTGGPAQNPRICGKEFLMWSLICKKLYDGSIGHGVLTTYNGKRPYWKWPMGFVCTSMKLRCGRSQLSMPQQGRSF